MTKANASTGRRRLMSLVKRSLLCDGSNTDTGPNLSSAACIKAKEIEALQLRAAAVRSLTPQRFRWMHR